MRISPIILILMLIITVVNGFKLTDKRIFDEKITGLYKYKDYIFVVIKNKEIVAYKIEYNYLEKIFKIKGRSKITNLVGFEAFRDFLIMTDKDYLLFVRLYSIRDEVMLYKDWEKSPPETLYVATYSKDYSNADFLILVDFGENKKYDHLVIIKNNPKKKISKISTIKLGDGFFREIWNKTLKGNVRCVTTFDYNEDSFENYLAICLENEIIVIDKVGDIVDKIEFKNANIISKANFDDDSFFDDLLVIRDKEIYKVEYENGISSLKKILEFNESIIKVLNVYSMNEFVGYYIVTKNNIYVFDNKLNMLDNFYINLPIELILNIDLDKDFVDDDLVIITDNKLILFEKSRVKLPEIKFSYKVTVENNKSTINYTLENIGDGKAFDVKIKFIYSTKSFVKEYNILEPNNSIKDYIRLNISEGDINVVIFYKDLNKILHKKVYIINLIKIYDFNISYKNESLNIKILRKQDEKIKVKDLNLRVFLRNLKFRDGSVERVYKNLKVKDIYYIKLKFIGKKGRIIAQLKYSYDNILYNITKSLELNLNDTITNTIVKKTETKVYKPNIMVKKYVEKNRVKYGDRLKVYINIVTNITVRKGFLKLKLNDTIPEDFKVVQGNLSAEILLLPKDNYTYVYIIEAKDGLFTFRKKRVILPNATLIYNGFKQYTNAVELYLEPKYNPILLLSILTLPIISLVLRFFRKKREDEKIRAIKNLLILYKRKGLKPTIKDLADKLGMREEDVRKLLRRIRR